MKRIQEITPCGIAMYDVEEQKLVAVFSSYNIATQHIFLSRTGSRDLWQYVTKKYKMLNNRFGRTICFRVAGEKHLQMLSGKDKIILDKRYGTVNYKPQVK